MTAIARVSIRGFSNCLIPYLVTVFFFLTILLSSCTSTALYERNLDVDCNSWNYNDTLLYTIEIKDSNQRYNLLLNLRHRDVYEWQNLYLKMAIMDPTGQVKSQEVNIPMCEEDGAWIGNCTGDVCFLRAYLIEHKKIFRTPGTYKIMILQDMRTDALKNILAVGIRVEPSPSKRNIKSKDHEN